MDLGINLGEEVSQSFQIDRSLEKHWNKKLTRGLQNLFPLAPLDLVRMGLVNEQEYTQQNQELSDFCQTTMQNELTAFLEHLSKTSQAPTLEVWGSGLSRDLGFLACASKLFPAIFLRDNSSVACANADEFLRDARLVDRLDMRVEVVQCDLRKDCGIDWQNTLMVYACQCFIQVQKPKAMAKIMRKLGKFLSLPNSLGMPARGVYLLTAREQDNNLPVEWRGVHFPSVEWGDSTPYNNADLLLPAQAALGNKGELELVEVARHQYYHQTYVLLRLVRKV